MTNLEYISQSPRNIADFFTDLLEELDFRGGVRNWRTRSWMEAWAQKERIEEVEAGQCWYMFSVKPNPDVKPHMMCKITILGIVQESSKEDPTVIYEAQFGGPYFMPVSKLLMLGYLTTEIEDITLINTLKKYGPIKPNEITVEDLDLSVRATTTLRRARRYTLADVLRTSNLMDVRGLGAKSGAEVCKKVSEILDLMGDTKSYPLTESYLYERHKVC